MTQGNKSELLKQFDPFNARSNKLLSDTSIEKRVSKNVKVFKYFELFDLARDKFELSIDVPQCKTVWNKHK